MVLPFEFFICPQLAGLKGLYWQPDFDGPWVDPGTAGIHRMVLILEITKD